MVPIYVKSKTRHNQSVMIEARRVEKLRLEGPAGELAVPNVFIWVVVTRMYTHEKIGQALQLTSVPFTEYYISIMKIR